MEAVQYLKSVPRYLVARFAGPRWPRIYTSPLSLVKLVDIERPRLPSPNWLRVRPILSGICGSDIATVTAQGSPYFSPFVSTPFVLGHEVVGVVEGPPQGPVQVGERVVIEPSLHCGVREVERACEACSRGKIGQCQNIRQGVISAGIQTGFCRDTGGGWSRSLVAHKSQLHPVPADAADDVAVLTEPLSCCLHAVHKARLEEHQAVVVLGCGTMGLLTIFSVRLLGHGCEILAVAKYDYQARKALDLGADRCVGSQLNLKEIAKEVGATVYPTELGRPSVLGGADVIFDCVGTSRTIDESMRLTRPGGRVIMVGMPGVARGVDWTAMWHKELHVVGSYTSDRKTFGQALEAVCANAATLDGFVGARFTLGDYRRALRLALRSGANQVIKVAFEITP